MVWPGGLRPFPSVDGTLALHASGRTAAERSAAAIWAIPGISAKVAYTRALALPEGQFLAGRNQHLLGRWRKALRAHRRKLPLG